MGEETAKRPARELRVVQSEHPGGYKYGQDISSSGGEYFTSDGDELPSASSAEAGGWDSFEDLFPVSVGTHHKP